MSFRRYEILLPNRYDDGQPVELDKFQVTNQDLVVKFGAARVQQETICGTRIQEGKAVQADYVHLYVNVEDTPPMVAFFKRYKETLKQRFRQIEIWIVSYEIRVT